MIARRRLLEQAIRRTALEVSEPFETWEIHKRRGRWHNWGGSFTKKQLSDEAERRLHVLQCLALREEA